MVKSLFTSLALTSSWRNVVVVYFADRNVLYSVFGPLSAVEHTSEERETHRADVRTLQHSRLLSLQIGGAICVSFTLTLSKIRWDKVHASCTGILMTIGC